MVRRFVLQLGRHLVEVHASLNNLTSTFSPLFPVKGRAAILFNGPFRDLFAPFQREHAIKLNSCGVNKMESGAFYDCGINFAVRGARFIVR